MDDYRPTSPELPTNSGIVSTPKQFSDALTLELTDEEIKRAMQIIIPIKEKWEMIFRSKFRNLGGTEENKERALEEVFELIEHMEDEIKTECANKLDLYVRVDHTPLFEGNPIIIDFDGVLPSHKSTKYGMDHEKKESEVKLAINRGEDFLGQKENIGAHRKRHRNQRRKDKDL